MHALSLLGTFVALLAAPPMAKAPASGTFNYNGRTYTATTAVAFRAGTFLKVVLSDKPFDPALGADGRIDDPDLMAHPSASMTITIDPETKGFFGVRFRDDKGSGADLR